MNYMAKCSGPCSSFKGDTGKPWFKVNRSCYQIGPCIYIYLLKIQQESYSNGIWASDALANNNHSYTVNIPSSIAPGEYVSCTLNIL